MGKTIKVQLSLSVDGATADEIVQGLAVAQAIFADARTTAFDAAEASFARDGHTAAPCPPKRCPTASAMN